MSLSRRALSRMAWLGPLLLGLWAVPAMGQSGPPSEAALPAAFADVDSLRMKGAFREALGRLRSLKTAHPTHAGVLYRLAVLRSDLGKATDDPARTVQLHRNAVAAAEAAVKADSTSAWAHLAVALAQGRLTEHVSPRERVERSRAVKAHVDRALALDSTLAPAYHVRGRWHQMAADLNFVQRAVVRLVYGGLPEASFAQAVDDFQRAIGLRTRTYHHVELGKTYLKMDRLANARNQWRTALSVPPVDPFASEFKREARRLLRKHR